MIRKIVIATIAVAAAVVTVHLAAQTPPRPAAGGASGRAGRGRGGGLGGAYNPRPAANPEQVARGKGLYGVNCTFCHGVDARGGEGGPNLLRSQLVLNDIQGEHIQSTIQEGRPERGMPKFDFSTSQIADLAAFIHSQSTGGRDPSRMAPPSILTGDAKAGEAYFQATCSSCHSVTGDLKGIGSKITDPKSLQQTWLMPGGGGFGAGAAATAVKPKTAAITLPTGEKVEGILVRIDDFTVTVRNNDGAVRTIARRGNTTVEVHDPLLPHKKLLSTYTDKDIHNLTAYLVTIK
jgi:mono/diheme cytochrome c family protein